MTTVCSASVMSNQLEVHDGCIQQLRNGDEPVETGQPDDWFGADYCEGQCSRVK